MSIEIKDLRVESISDKHLPLLHNFITYEPDLKNFLIEDAISNQYNKISKTFLLFHKNNLVGYITLLCDSLRVEGEIKELCKNINVPYKTLPAIKIGKLAVDDNYLKKGFGTKLLHLAYNYAKHVSDKYCGCRFLVLDAKRNKDKSKNSLHFYKKMNFNILKNKEKGTIPMYLDLMI